MSDNLYLSHKQIADALGSTEAGLRAMRRLTSARLRIVNLRPSHHGKLPAAYHLGDVIEWLTPLGGLLTRQAELTMREAARPL